MAILYTHGSVANLLLLHVMLVGGIMRLWLDMVCPLWTRYADRKEISSPKPPENPRRQALTHARRDAPPPHATEWPKHQVEEPPLPCTAKVPPYSTCLTPTLDTTNWITHAKGSPPQMPPVTAGEIRQATWAIHRDWNQSDLRYGGGVSRLRLSGSQAKNIAAGLYSLYRVSSLMQEYYFERAYCISPLSPTPCCVLVGAALLPWQDWIRISLITLTNSPETDH